MNARDHHAITSVPDAGAGLSGRYHVTMTLDVTDARGLWNAALRRGLLAPDATYQDVVDTIGPCEDPAIMDCLTMLAMPADLQGCAIDAFTIDPVLTRTLVEHPRRWSAQTRALR